MQVISKGQDLSAALWSRVQAEDWRTETESKPLDIRYAFPSVPQTAFVFLNAEETFEADEDIAAGRVAAFDSMDDLIADLHNPG